MVGTQIWMSLLKVPNAEYAGSPWYSNDEFSLPNMINNCSLAFLGFYSSGYASTYETNKNPVCLQN